MNLKEELTHEALRLEATIANNNDLSAIKAARTRWENKHRAYWRAVRDAQKELQKDKRKRPDSVAKDAGIDPLDLMEMTVNESE